MAHLIVMFVAKTPGSETPSFITGKGKEEPGVQRRLPIQALQGPAEPCAPTPVGRVCEYRTAGSNSATFARAAAIRVGEPNPALASMSLNVSMVAVGLDNDGSGTGSSLYTVRLILGKCMRRHSLRVTIRSASLTVSQR